MSPFRDASFQRIVDGNYDFETKKKRKEFRRGQNQQGKLERRLGLSARTPSKQRDCSVRVSADSDPAKCAVDLTHGPKIEIGAEPIAGSIERG